MVAAATNRSCNIMDEGDTGQNVWTDTKLNQLSLEVCKSR